MKITITGKIGSGKSTVAREIAKRLSFKYFEMGDIWSRLAAERGVTVFDLVQLAETDKSIDDEIDSTQKKIGDDEDDFVMDSRLGFHFIPQSFKIFLDVDPDVAAGRVFSQKREDEKENVDLATTKELMLKRMESESKRYNSLYGVNYLDVHNFDLVIDTTNKTPDAIVEEIIQKVQEKQDNA